jgi:hypothetical protein
MSDSNTFYPPRQQQLHLFRGAVTNPKPGNRSIIFTFNGTHIKTAVAYEYSKIWGICVAGEAQDRELDIFRTIKEKSKGDRQTLNRYVDFGNCPPSVAFEDWAQSAADAVLKILPQLSGGKKCSVILLSTHPLWAGKTRMHRIYKKLRMDTAYLPLPDSFLASEVEKKGRRISKGNVLQSAAVDADYYLLAIKKESTRYSVTRVCIGRAGTPLVFSKNSSKNRCTPLQVVPFTENSDRYDLFLTREKGNSHSLVSASRVVTPEKTLKPSLRFEPLEEAPTLHAGDNVLTPLYIKAMPDIAVKPDPQPLQVAVLIDATMPEDQVEPAKEKLITMAQTIASTNPDARFGLSLYGDYSEPNRTAEFTVKSPGNRFIPASQWTKLCKQEIKHISPMDFMTALDQGLTHSDALFKSADPKAQRHLVLIFSSTPHPKNDIKRDIYKSPFTRADNDWKILLEKLKLYNHVNIFVVYLPKDVKGNKAGEIQREIDIVCREMKDFGFKGKGIDKISEIQAAILKGVEVRWRLVPDTYHIPIIIEEQP